MSKPTLIMTGFFVVLFYLHLVGAECLCKAGYTCMGTVCLGWRLDDLHRCTLYDFLYPVYCLYRAMIGVVGACITAFILVCAAVGYLGMKLVEHILPLCERKVEPAPAVSEEGNT